MMLTLLPQPSLETGRDVHVDTHNHHTITLYVHYYRYVEQTDRQADRQADRQTDKQTDIQTDKQTDRQTDRQLRM